MYYVYNCFLICTSIINTKKCLTPIQIWYIIDSQNNYSWKVIFFQTPVPLTANFPKHMLCYPLPSQPHKLHSKGSTCSPTAGRSIFYVQNFKICFNQKEYTCSLKHFLYFLNFRCQSVRVVGNNKAYLQIWEADFVHHLIS